MWSASCTSATRLPRWVPLGWLSCCFASLTVYNRRGLVGLGIRHSLVLQWPVPLLKRPQLSSGSCCCCPCLMALLQWWTMPQSSLCTFLLTWVTSLQVGFTGLCSPCTHTLAGIAARHLPCHHIVSLDGQGGTLRGAHCCCLTLFCLHQCMTCCSI